MKKLQMLFFCIQSFVVGSGCYAIKDLEKMMLVSSESVPRAELLPLIAELQGIVLYEEMKDLFFDDSSKQEDFDIKTIPKTLDNVKKFLVHDSSGVSRNRGALHYCYQCEVFFKYWGVHKNKHHPHNKSASDVVTIKLSNNQVKTLKELWFLKS